MPERELNPMKSIHLTLTTEEAELLSSLASDQLFRKEFIDPKMPGHKTNKEAIRLGKQLVERLQSMANEAKGVQPLRKNAPSVKASAASAEKHNQVEIQLT
jgi:hypothetical protein